MTINRLLNDYPNACTSGHDIVHFGNAQAEIEAVTTQTACIAPLHMLGVIKIHGPDTVTFLQSQFTCDVNTLDQQACLGAYCDRKGRMLCNFHLFYHRDAIHLCLPRSMVKLTVDTLKKYALFSKVTMDYLDNTTLLGLLHEASAPTNNNMFAIDIAANRTLLMLTDSELSTYWLDLTRSREAIGLNAWTYHDIQQGYAYIQPTTSLQFLPQSLNLDKLGGISFNKGCYLGQEIVARTTHLGKLKKKLRVIEVLPQTLSVGDPITTPTDPKARIIAYASTEQAMKVMVIGR